MLSGDFLDQLEKEDIDFFVVLAFAQFLGKRVLELPKIACFNIHTSLLPKYRGAAPIQYALLNGDKTTGVSIQKMVKKMDAGDLVKECEIPVSHSETGGQLYTRLKFQAALTLNNLISDILNDNVSTKVQNEDEVSFAPTLKKEDGHINFHDDSFITIWNKVRALKPWPGTYAFLNDKRLKIIEIKEYPSLKVSPGQVVLKDKKLLVGCADKTIRLSYVQLEGKKPSSDTELANGLQNTKDELIIK